MKKKEKKVRNVVTDFRPEFFREIVGQEFVVQSLKNLIIEDKIPNAILFSGAIGSGKTTMVRLLGKATSCLDRKPDECEPCGKCDSCIYSVRNICGSHYAYLAAGTKLSVQSFDKFLQYPMVGALNSNAKVISIHIDDLDGLAKNQQQYLRSALDVTWSGYLVATSTNPDEIDPALRSRLMEFVLSPPDQPTIERWAKGIATRLGLQIKEEQAVGLLVRLAELNFRSILKILQTMRAAEMPIDTVNVKLAALQNGYGV